MGITKVAHSHLDFLGVTFFPLGLLLAPEYAMLLNPKTHYQFSA
jgi:hypothetical protein